MRVWWATEQDWFDGTVGLTLVQNGRTIHRVDYDDGDARWYNLRDAQRVVWEPASRAAWRAATQRAGGFYRFEMLNAIARSTLASALR